MSVLFKHRIFAKQKKEGDCQEVSDLPIPESDPLTTKHDR